ncbi:MAG: hypothetical protein HZB31_12550 [Nitrospirae bacterium]|nr:hypothetical protein [Nitrospirota bacterium]
MSFTFRFLSLVGIFILMLYSPLTASQKESQMNQRVKKIRESVFRIVVNGQPSGTGFAVAPDLVATDFHVVQQISQAPNGQTSVTFAQQIEVEFADGTRFPAMPHPTVSGANLKESLVRTLLY